ncbi:ribonuclease Y [Desulfoluna butyratoxydans]|uniref:Ribonuclease Y n=1 Tax=Desulfoluna butyratoxydans TaxID=231438 RepID=A0A4U8YIG4_9BACT|nr:ribonuclease Y [Desulfoluna butyratoxydans]VFQ43381.1 ribonuclease y [Desulfoluna butyratoxydans]
MVVKIMATGIVGFLVGAALTFVLKGRVDSRRAEEAEEEAEKIIRDAGLRAENLLMEANVEAKDRLIKMKSEFDAETNETRLELKGLDKRLNQKAEKLDRRQDQIERIETDLSQRSKQLTEDADTLADKNRECDALVTEQKMQLEKISGMTSEEAKGLLLSAMENEARHDGAKMIKRVTSEAKESADKEAKKIIATAIQRYAGDFVAERTVSVVPLPNDEMKGRIIGREGRNIRALEAATGIDLIIDDTPEAVILSGFNPVRREVARLSLTKLINDGRIHPARIEEVVKTVEKEVDQTIREAGDQAAFDLGVHGISNDLIAILGRLKFRTSYAQNVLQHSVEVGFLCGVMAAELGLNVKLAKRMGLLHDIGKAVDHEVEGPHAVIGANLAKKYGENPKIVQGIAAHHEDVPPESVYDLLVQAADSLSGARPGARKELLENYVKRLDDLEKIANGYKGVANSYAIQAGRELRVIVEGDVVRDEDAVVMSRDIAKQIEESLTFPGQIRVTVIRETRAVGYANK